MEYLKIVLLTIGILSIAFVGLAINILIKKGGKFPNTHVGGNRHLKSKGVYCSQTQDKIEQLNANRKSKFQKLKFVPENK
jgi:hypothetical protein